MITYVDKNGKVIKEANRSVEREDKNGKSLGSSSGINVTVEDKAGNAIREEKATPKKPRRSSKRSKRAEAQEEISEE